MLDTNHFEKSLKLLIKSIKFQRSAAPSVELKKSERSDRKILQQSSSSSEWLQK